MLFQWLVSFAISFFSVLLAMTLLLLCALPILNWLFKRFMNRLMSDRYPENIWEMVSAVKRLNPIVVVENSLRAESGKVIERPFGSSRKFLNFNELIFSPAQLAVMPTDENTEVDTKTVIGPNAEKSLQLDIPLLMGAMGYGIGVSEKLRLAMAIGTAAVGTATNIGEGGFLPEDRKNAKYLIYQYGSGKWSKNPELISQSDAIEIHIGQGASAAAASRIPPEYIQGRARDILGLQPGETAVVPSRHEDINEPKDMKTLVDTLRKMGSGVPVGVKICASNQIEKDLDICIDAGVDFISIDGGQAGTKGGPPILEDDFGLPTVYALARTVQHLKKRGVKDKISLLAGGGFFTPGDCLKALALGADAIYLGTAALWAMTHTQVTKTLPFEPPTELVFYPGKMTDKFDEEEAAYYLRNFLESFVEEMKIAVLALGKTSIKEVTKDDLVALDEKISDVTQIPLAYSKKSDSPVRVIHYTE